MRRGAGRWIGLAAAVIAAMALGQLITDKLPLDQGAADPFVRSGSVGDTVRLSYADVEVEGVRMARRLYGVDGVLPAGRFLIVDVTIEATHEATSLQGFELIDGTGRRFAPMDRGTTCSKSTTAPAGVPWHAMLCFDVPRSAVEGARFVVARGAYGTDGADQRRDDLASFDLGLTRAEAARLWAQDLGYDAQQAGLETIDTSVVPKDES